MSNRSNHICPLEKAKKLDSRFRKWLQNPQKTLSPYIEEGMTALDIGCGPGFFSIALAQMVGPSGRVIAADLQEGMLNKVRDKLQGTELEERVTLHKCEKTKIGVSEHVDFVLLFYMVHEVPNKEALFKEIATILTSKGLVFLVEPPFHVSRKAFEKTVRKARDAGLKDIERPRMFPSKAVVLKKG